LAEEQNIKQKAKKGVYWSTFSNVANQGTQFVIGIILARLLSPEDYGVIALPTIFLAIAQCFIDSGFSSALVRKEQVTEDDLTTAFYFNVCVGVFFYSLLFLCSPLIADFYNTPILSDILKVTALGLLFGPLQSVHFALFSRKLDFKTPSIISVSSKLTTGAVGILLAFLGFGIWALVFQGIAGSLLSLAIVWTRSDWRPKGRFSRESFNYLWGYGSKLLSSSILDTLYNNIVPVFVGKFFSPRDLGLLNRGTGYATMPHNQIGSIVGPLTFPVFSRIQSDKEQLDNYFRKLLRLIIFVQAPINLLLVALAKPLVIFFITDKWIDCVLIVQMVAVAAVIWPIQSLNMSLFNAVGRSDLVLKGNIGIKVIGLCTLIPCLPFGIYFITSMGIFRGLLAVSWMAYFAGKVTKYGIFRQYKEILPVVTLAASMCGLVFLVTSFIETPFLQLVAGGVVGSFFYVGTAYILRFKELQDVLYLLKIKKQ